MACHPASSDISHQTHAELQRHRSLGDHAEIRGIKGFGSGVISIPTEDVELVQLSDSDASED